METYWCTQKHSIIDMMNGKEIPPALSPCCKSECEQWRDGECSHISKAGKPDKPQVFSRQDNLGEKYIITQIKGTDIKYLLFIVLLVAILITAGCVGNKEAVVTSIPTPTPPVIQAQDPIIGVWRISLSTGYYDIYRFNADGTFVSSLRKKWDTWHISRSHGTWSTQGNNSYTLYDSTPGEDETFIYDSVRNGIYNTKYPPFLLRRIQGYVAYPNVIPRVLTRYEGL